MCNGVAPVLDKTDNTVDDKIHATVNFKLKIGDIGLSVCGVSRPLQGYGTDRVNCPECLSRLGSYGY